MVFHAVKGAPETGCGSSLGPKGQGDTVTCLGPTEVEATSGW